MFNLFYKYIFVEGYLTFNQRIATYPIDTVDHHNQRNCPYMYIYRFEDTQQIRHHKRHLLYNFHQHQHLLNNYSTNESVYEL